jgi:hypothetical protein
MARAKVSSRCTGHVERDLLQWMGGKGAWLG